MCGRVLIRASPGTTKPHQLDLRSRRVVALLHLPLYASQPALVNHFLCLFDSVIDNFFFLLLLLINESQQPAQMDWAGFLKSETAPQEKKDPGIIPREPSHVGWVEALAAIKEPMGEPKEVKEAKETKESFLSRVSKARLIVRISSCMRLPACLTRWYYSLRWTRVRPCDSVTSSPWTTPSRSAMR